MQRYSLYFGVFLSLIPHDDVFALHSDTDITTLFLYRYLLDKPDPVHNLYKDIEDLKHFPERIDGSYRAEWTTYVKRQLHKLKQLDKQQQQDFWSRLSQKMQQPQQDRDLCAALEQIQTSLKINASDKVSVIKIPVKTYIEQLIKL